MTKLTVCIIAVFFGLIVCKDRKNKIESSIQEHKVFEMGIICGEAAALTYIHDEFIGIHHPDGVTSFCTNFANDKFPEYSAK